MVTSGVEHRTFSQATRDKKNGLDAMGNEIGAMEENQTWTIEEFSIGKKAIASKWVYKIKYHSDGITERYKAMMIACGYR